MRSENAQPGLLLIERRSRLLLCPLKGTGGLLGGKRVFFRVFGVSMQHQIYFY